MEPKIDVEEMDEIVGEVARIQRDESDALDKEQAREVLRELDLPAERLDEARAAVAAKRRTEHERAKRFGIVAAVAVSILSVAGIVAWSAHARSEVVGQVMASTATISAEGSPTPGPILRAARPEVRLDVVLAHAPQGQALELACDWNGPGGDVRHQNRFTTKVIDKDVWPTHCRYRIESQDPAGEWSVTMRQNDRTLATQGFKVE